MEIRVWRFQNYRDCGYTCNPHKFEIPALQFPRKDPVIPCKHLQCSMICTPYKWAMDCYTLKTLIHANEIKCVQSILLPKQIA